MATRHDCNRTSHGSGLSQPCGCPATVIAVVRRRPHLQDPTRLAQCATPEPNGEHIGSVSAKRSCQVHASKQSQPDVVRVRMRASCHGRYHRRRDRDSRGGLAATVTPPKRRGTGVYVLAYKDEGEHPRRLAVAGHRLARFMDSIYLDRACERLTAQQIVALNAARRPLLRVPEIGSTNERVKRAMAAAIKAERSRRVLEWGCGYETMYRLLSVDQYGCFDIDPQVIEWHRFRWFRRRGKTIYGTESDLKAIVPESYDAIVSAFVFHFRISRLHILTMSRILTHAGFVLANVYRRSARSRDALIAEFEKAGLRVQRAPDTSGLCSDHEFWVLSKDRSEERFDRILRTLSSRLPSTRSPRRDTEHRTRRL
jgi:SAM-dependent methyltransferase